MANTERTNLRVKSELIRRVAERHGLDASNVSHVVRFAVALAAGVDDVAAAAVLPLGPKRRAA